MRVLITHDGQANIMAVSTDSVFNDKQVHYEIEISIAW